MAAESLGELACESLLERQEELARAITGALYEEMPELMERYGERGHAKCLQDMRYNLEHLAAAVALGEPGVFARYVVWLRDLLHARGIPATEVRRSLELTEQVTRTRLSGPEADAVARVLAAGLEVLAAAGDA
jgi:MerR family transcriptional regulator, light-induced transcriptional regulator